jgi:hypothetical protein
MKKNYRVRRSCMNIALERVHVAYRTLAGKQVAIAQVLGVASRHIVRFGAAAECHRQGDAGDQVFEDQTISLESLLWRVILPATVLA